MPAKSAAEPNVYYWSLPEVLSADDIESASIQLQNNSRLVLDITTLREVGLGAEGRLLALLVSAKRQNKFTTIQVEKLSLSEAESPILKLLVFTSLGLIIGRMSDSIIDYEDNEYIVEIRRLQSVHLKDSHGYLSNDSITEGKSTSLNFCALIADEFGRPTTPILWKQREPAPFTFYFKKCLSQYLKIPATNSKLIERINDYVFEAFQNTFDHASKDFNGHPIHGLRFISIRYYNLINLPIDSLIVRNRNPVTYALGDPISSYLSFIQDEIMNNAESDFTIESLLEVTIADSGYGIPARMEKLENSLELSPEDEEILLERALKPGGSSKSDSVVGAGLGLFKMMESACRLQGLILFRTGQLNMYRYYGNSEENWPSTSSKVEENWDALKLHKWDETPCGYLSGTCISMIFPLKTEIKEPKVITPPIDDVVRSSDNAHEVHQLKLFI
jgi:hypothetical protein